jgi:hypothetical protein
MVASLNLLFYRFGCQVVILVRQLMSAKHGLVLNLEKSKMVITKPLGVSLQV